MLWTGGARVSKEGRRATAEHALRPGGALRASRSWRRRRHAWRHGQRRCDVGRAEAGQRGVGKAAARQGRARGLV
jgi:hypothetical protein